MWSDMGKKVQWEPRVEVAQDGGRADYLKPVAVSGLLQRQVTHPHFGERAQVGGEINMDLAAGVVHAQIDIAIPDLDPPYGIAFQIGELESQDRLSTRQTGRVDALPYIPH